MRIRNRSPLGDLDVAFSFGRQIVEFGEIVDVPNDDEALALLEQTEVWEAAD